MPYEYLLFNLIIVAGPIAASFERNVRYVQHWQRVLLAILPVAAVFLTWDILVTGRHWWFNEAYTLPVKLLGLPPGEWLFFFTVPFACLLLWETLRWYFPYKRVLASWRVLFPVLTGVFAVGGAAALVFGREYTGIVLLVSAATLVLDRVLKTNVFASYRITQYLSFIVLLILVFNLYLTARPVVLYGDPYFLGIRVITIPLEDFFYGLSYLSAVLVVYEALSRTHRERQRREYRRNREGRRDG